MPSKSQDTFGSTISGSTRFVSCRSLWTTGRRSRRTCRNNIVTRLLESPRQRLSMLKKAVSSTATQVMHCLRRSAHAGLTGPTSMSVSCSTRTTLNDNSLKRHPTVGPGLFKNGCFHLVHCILAKRRSFGGAMKCIHACEAFPGESPRGAVRPDAWIAQNAHHNWMALIPEGTLQTAVEVCMTHGQEL